MQPCMVAGAVVLSLAGLYMLCMKGGELSVNKGSSHAGMRISFAVHIMIIDFFSCCGRSKDVLYPVLSAASPQEQPC